MIDTARTFIFFGMSGAGKGTQTKFLNEYLTEKDTERTTLYISTGDLFREFMESGTYTANKVKAILDEGGLLPEFLPIWVWTTFFDKHIKNNTENLILDGLARQPKEAPVLEGALSFYERKRVDIVVINVSRELAIERLKERGRYDDNDDDIKNRLDWYESNVIPSINYFRENTPFIVHDINGERSIDEVRKEVLEKTELV